MAREAVRGLVFTTLAILDFYLVHSRAAFAWKIGTQDERAQPTALPLFAEPFGALRHY